MPWSGHLFIGQPVRDYAELRAVLTKLDIPCERASDDFELFDGSFGRQIALKLHDRTFYAWLAAELSDDFLFPAHPGESTGAAVALRLTNRYKGAVLDADAQSGRTDPFCFDPEDIAELLRQVRIFWPEAQAMIWDVHF